MKKVHPDLFASAYVRSNCNGVRALRAMGHQGTSGVLRTAAWRLLTNVDVQKTLAKLRKEAAMDALEAVAHMADMARASLEDFLDRNGCVDIAKARRLGKLHLVKELRVKEHKVGEDENAKAVVIETSLKLYDAQAALKTMMEYHGLLTDNLELRRLPKDPAELREFIRQRLPMLFETRDQKKVH